MSPTEILIMSGFGLLVVAGLIAGIVQGRRERARIREFAAGHGWPLAIGGADPRLEARLAEAVPDESWSPWYRLTIEPPPAAFHLFSYNTRSRRGPGGRSSGYACLAEIDGGAPHPPVTVSPRIPGLDKLVGDRVAAGSQEFRETFTVTAENAGVAARLLNLDIQGLLLRDRAAASRYLTATFSGRAVLVSTFWAKEPVEWTRLIELTRGLRDAARRVD